MNFSERKLRLTLVIPSLEAGGAERILSGLANEWAEEGHKVTILTWDKEGVPFFYLQPSIKHESLNLLGTSSSYGIAALSSLKRIYVLRKVILNSHPDFVVSFIDRTNITVLIAMLGTHIPTFVADRSDPEKYPEEKLWRILRRITYPLAEQVIVQTDEARDFFVRGTGCSVTVIPNPATIPTASNYLGEKLKRPAIVSVGRLVRHKGYDVLLHSMKHVNKLFPQWSCFVIGEGKERNSLEQLRNKLGLTQIFNFLGQRANPEHFLDQADLFVLPSRLEGFPNVVIEAMARGVPVVATSTCGTRAIVRHGVDGLLVPADDPILLGSAIARLLEDEKTRLQMANRAKEVLERFEPTGIYEKWADLFKNLPNARF